jgi:hypothetical protein
MPPAVGLAVGALGSLGGSIIGAAQSSADQQAARQAALSAFQQYAALGTPPNMATPLILQQMQQQGILTPQLESEIKQGPTQLAQVHLNQQLQNTQDTALQSLMNQGQGGYTPQERAALNQILQQTGGATQAKVAQIQQQMQSRGLADSGSNLAAQLSAAQGGANQAQNAGLQVASQGNQNALQALSQAGALGGQMQQQQYNVGANAARAQDLINQFNTQNSISQQARNVQANNAAQAQNLANKQAIANYNAQQANQEQLRELQGQQQNWQNQMGLASAKANADIGQANYLGQQAAQTANQWQNIGQGFGGAGNAYAQYGNNQNLIGAITGLGQPAQTSTATVPSEESEESAPVYPNYSEMYGSPGAQSSSPWYGNNQTQIAAMAMGGKIPGNATTDGDHYKNDKVLIKASPGEIILPRSVTQSKNAPEDAAEFVRKLLKKY